MKRIFLAFLAFVLAILGIYAAEKLPADRTDLIEEKYRTWSGVIRIWTVEGSGTAAWLNGSAAAIEKTYEGVYVNVQEVPAQAIAGFRDTGINPPDIIIYPAGLVTDDAGLAPITAAYSLRRGLTQSAYAAPVLARPRFIIYDASAMDALPPDLYETTIACAEGDLNALTALCTGLRHSDGETQALPGVDLGLGGDTGATPAPEGDVACRTGAGLIITENPRQAFLEDQVDAFVGGIDDVLRLADASGWAAAVTGEYTYITDMTMCSIIARDDGRMEICRAYVDQLLGAGQSGAAQARAVPVVTGTAAWSGDPAMAAPEAALERLTWIAGVSGSSDAARLYIEGTISADEAIAAIR